MASDAITSANRDVAARPQAAGADLSGTRHTLRDEVLAGSSQRTGIPRQAEDEASAAQELP